MIKMNEMSLMSEMNEITDLTKITWINEMIEQSREINSEQIVDVIFEQQQGNKDQHFIQRPRYLDCVSLDHGGDKDYRK